MRWKWFSLESRLSWSFLWRFLLVLVIVVAFYLAAVIIVFNNVSELIGLKNKFNPRDLLVRVVERTKWQGEKPVIPREVLSEVGTGHRGWVQILDQTGQEVYAYRRPDMFPTHYRMGELADYKKGLDDQLGYELFTWTSKVNGRDMTWILGLPDPERQLLYQIRTQTSWRGEQASIPASLLKKVKSQGYWVQIVDDTGKVVYGYRANGRPTFYAPGVFLNYMQDHNLIYQRQEKGGRRYTWIMGLKPALKTYAAEVATDNELKQFEQMKKILSISTFVGNGLILLTVALLFGRRFGRPLLHMVGWLQQLVGGEYREPIDRHGKPRSRDPKNGELRRNYRIYREVLEVLRQLTETLKQNEERRQKLNQAREDWIAGVSHDLKTPLSSVKGYAYLMAAERYEWAPEEIRRYADVIRDKALYMEQLIEDLNLTFRLKNEALPLQLQTVDIVEEVRRAVIDLTNDPQAQAYEVDFHAWVEKIQYPVDRKWFGRALANLLDNAIFHNPPGTKVEVTMYQQKERWGILLSDNGCGMDEETLSGLFERYYRGTNTARGGKGTGLGMAIAKQLIEAHGGRIEVESAPGQGTVIRLSFPVMGMLDALPQIT